MPSIDRRKPFKAALAALGETQTAIDELIARAEHVTAMPAAASRPTAA